MFILEKKLESWSYIKGTHFKSWPKIRRGYYYYSFINGCQNTNIFKMQIHFLSSSLASIGEFYIFLMYVNAGNVM